MKKRLRLSVTAIGAVLTLSLFGCNNIYKPDTKKVADNALAILKSMRGATSGCYEPGGGDYGRRFGTDRVDSVFVDEIERGVRTVGWLRYNDNETPFDTTDDIVSFRGQKIYLDWDVTENVWLSVHVWVNDRATEMAVKNVTTSESSYVNLGQVNRPGGIQSGPAFWTNYQQSVAMTMGVHHMETPDDWSDNYSYLEFVLTDETAADNRFFVHADFRPDHSGSGEIRNQNNELVATFQWDNFGRGALVIDGDIYPFRW